MASEPAAESGNDITASETLASIVDAYERMDMEMSRYIFLIVLPSLVFFAGTVAVAVFVDLPLSVRLPIPLLGGLVLFAAIAYPKLLVSQERVEMENQYHLMMTHMTVLSTTNIDRMEVFRKLGEEKEYGALSAEINRVVQLVDTWNQSLDDACRRRARRIPSEPLSDFFDRLAYTVNAGQELSEFLLSEQQVMIQNYVTMYESTLDNLEVMKDLYLSMVLSMTFALVFAIVLPILTGTNPSMTVGAVIVLYGFVQTGFFLIIRTMSPYDPLWYYPDDVRPEGEWSMIGSLVAGGVLSVVLIILVAGDLFGIGPGLTDLLPVSSLPRPIYLAIPVTPLAIPGIVFRVEEERIKARDDEFPSFIRALGASETAKQSTTTAVLKTLRKKDFGPLTDDVDDLFKRLNMRLEPDRAWQYFTANTRSYLIQKFSEMYLVGRQMGGEPKQLGELISQNMNHVNQLRQQREQATVTMIGLLYGITAASSFAFFIGFKIVDILAEMSLDLGTSSQMNVGKLIHTEVYDLPFIQFLLLGVVMINAVLSSLIIRTVDGGHKANALLHFVMLTWIGCVVAVLTMSVVGGLLNV
ncbi:archaellar assembly protein FlaJ [Haloplanus aerogenes]|uniref:Archaellar assembly protein FlaJ n=1 Tax=Haloplanus aerogenes TaxID=660522 RepID=A0A3M0E9V2_9EURY|nr:archaellar assembly protein FlaJ [Haloplanus aerogenes]AZH25314.1 archaellar assembly protein FlaJ [Haloplanus aerogenes]RMB25010.1 flagellar protein FlaJ [Haloplanus aerogenes]